MKTEIMNIIDDIMIKTEYLEAYNRIIEGTTDALENKGLNNIISILRAIVSASNKEITEINEKLDGFYCNISKIEESEKK